MERRPLDCALVSTAGARDGSNDNVTGTLDARDAPTTTADRDARAGALRRVVRSLFGRPSSTAADPVETDEHAVRSDRFDDFYRINYAPVVRLAMSLCGSATDAEELAARAFLAAHRRWRRIVLHDRPDRWVRRVVVNRAVTYGDPADDDVLPRASTASTRLLHFEPTDPALWEALRDLAPRHAQVLALIYVDDQPTSDVAAILGLDEQRVRALLDTARVRLARLLQEHDRGGLR